MKVRRAGGDSDINVGDIPRLADEQLAKFGGERARVWGLGIWKYGL